MSEEALQFVASDWRARSQNSLRGFFTLTLPSGLILKECSLHEKEGARWVGMPARQYEKDGAKAWAKIIDFASKAAAQEFQQLALAAFHEVIGGGE